MKIYTNTFDLRQPSEKKFWVAPHSDFKIGIKVIGAMGTDNSIGTSGIELYKDGEKLTVNSTGNGMAFWKIKSEGTGEVTYTVKAKMFAEASKYLGQFTLTQVVTDSTVYDVSEARGELPADVEFDSVETQIINSVVGEFTNVKTAEFTIGNTAITESNIILNDGGVSKIKKLTQAEYDSLSTKEENTLYIITE